MDKQGCWHLGRLLPGTEIILETNTTTGASGAQAHRPTASLVDLVICAATASSGSSEVGGIRRLRRRLLAEEGLGRCSTAIPSTASGRGSQARSTACMGRGGGEKGVRARGERGGIGKGDELAWPDR